MQILQRDARVGDLVRVRQQRWRVADLQAFESCSLLTLTGAGVSNLGVQRGFVAPFDRVEKVYESVEPRWCSAHRWQDQLRALVANAGSSESLRTARSADIALLAHQLEPVLAVTRGMGTRVLIADEVGLGKTIQAGLIIAELRARGAADKVLIVTPAGLRDQWIDELQKRFALVAVVLDARQVRQRLTELTIGINPWATYSIVVASADYVKRPEVLAAVIGCAWDALVIDEAHAAPPGTDRHQAYSCLAARTPYVVLLTATPHSGDREAFRSLCELGLQPRTTAAAARMDRLLVFRRTRQEVELGPGRRVHRLLVVPTPDELHVHRLLDEFTVAVRQDRGDADRDVWLALTMLHKRAFSSTRALELTLRRRLMGLAESAGPSQLVLPLDDAEGELDGADAGPAWTGPALNDVGRERLLLSTLADAAACAAKAESKFTRLGRLLASVGRRGEHALVFTEYRDTLCHLEEWLTTATHARVGILHGGLSRLERQRAVDDFVTGRLPILLATDAAGEGLNLHRSCRVVINLELPWNPVRLEQRVGRVDRIGQSRRVHAFHLVAHATGEAGIAERLRSRIAISRAEVGGGDPLGDAEASTEGLAAAEVLGGWRVQRPAGPPAETSGTYDREERLQFVRLKPQAIEEIARLERSRTLLHREVGGTAQCALISRARGSRVRALLGSAWLAVVRSALEDACGRCIAERLTVLRLDVRPLPRAGALALAKCAITALEERASDMIRRDREEWLSASVNWHAAFRAARLARGGLPVEVQAGRLSQLGLFTRHADRASRNETRPPGPPSSGAWIADSSELRVATGRVVLLLLP